ncbi:universal stress protein [Mycolicibacterium sp. CH28]|uniref:universal stress protein n=1 Tax=Mycolicibacterium sp. CH28 TaxID=2512237 RepID=UPI001080C184|nr:universal stress protein [Mycolicibacterium sp. CH28]TGD87437.1 universal stress protein [Mycolicibacterium sp. CH28]
MGHTAGASGEIIVGVDGSAASNAAVRWAAHEGGTRNIALRLVHVAQAPAVTNVMTPVPTEFEEWQDTQARQVLAEARELVAQVGTETGAPARIADADIYHATPVPTLVDLSKGAELIVVGSRGMGAFRRGLLGSISTGLIHHAHCPVAVIHDGPVPASHLPVVVGIDGSPLSSEATDLAFAEASRRGVDLVAVHAWSDDSLFAVPGVDWSAVAAGEAELLAERLAGMAEDYPDVTVHRVVVRDQPARYLAEQAQNAQLLVVGSHGRGGFAGLLLGSVSTALAHTVTIPLIVARRH